MIRLVMLSGVSSSPPVRTWNRMMTATRAMAMPYWRVLPWNSSRRREREGFRVRSFTSGPRFGS